MKSDRSSAAAGKIKSSIEHNARRWEVKTNRHPTTSGYAWGWIEGAPGNLCWSNDKDFDQSAASEVVSWHNEWLEQQTPVEIRLVKIDTEIERIAKIEADLMQRINEVRSDKDVLLLNRAIIEDERK